MHVSNLRSRNADFVRFLFVRHRRACRYARRKTAVGKGESPGDAPSEGMDKMGEMTDGMPMKGETKIKMELKRMKEMKEKMAEKMKAAKDGQPSTENKSAKPKAAVKDAHQH